MGGQTALPMAGSGQQAGGTPLGGTPIGGTPGISPMGQPGNPGMGQPGQMGQPPIQTQAMLAQPGYSAPTGMGSAASALSQLQAAQNMMQGMPGQMGQSGMGQSGMGSAANALSQLEAARATLGQTPAFQFGDVAGRQQYLQSLSPEQQQAYQFLQQNQPKPLVGPPMGNPGMGSAASALSQPQKQLGTTYTVGQPGTPPGLGVTQQQLQQLQMPQASPMQRPEMAGGMPQQRPGFNMPQRFQDRLPPQFSQGLGALAQNMRNRFR